MIAVKDNRNAENEKIMYTPEITSFINIFFYIKVGFAGSKLHGLVNMT